MDKFESWFKVIIVRLCFSVSLPSTHLSHPFEGANPESWTAKASLLLWSEIPIPKSLFFKWRQTTHVGSDLSSPQCQGGQSLPALRLSLEGGWERGGRLVSHSITTSADWETSNTFSKQKYSFTQILLVYHLILMLFI